MMLCKRPAGSKAPTGRKRTQGSLFVFVQVGLCPTVTVSPLFVCYITQNNPVRSKDARQQLRQRRVCSGDMAAVAVQTNNIVCACDCDRPFR